MDDEAAAANKVAWSWVLGALCRVLNASDLYGKKPLRGLVFTPFLLFLVKNPLNFVLLDWFERCPELFGYLDKDGREVLALRCLEELFAPCDGSETEDITHNHSRIGLDLSNSCVDVLNCLSLEVLLSNPGRPVTAKLKRDVHSFVERKKASVPKCMLEKLKDAILQGTFSVPNSMKAACGLLVDENRDLRIHAEDAKEVKSRSRLDLAGVDEATARKASDGEVLQEDSPRSISSASERDRTDLTDGISPRDSLSSVDSIENVDDQQTVSMDMVLENECAARSEDHVTKKLDDSGSDEDQRTIVVQNQEDELTDPRPENVALSGKESVATKDMANQGDSERSKDDKDCEDGTGNKLCMMCNEGGKILICSGNGCETVIHDRCLCCPLTCDNNGNFYCPFCAYMDAISDYDKAKKNASLARKELSLFIDGTRSCQPQYHSSGVDLDDSTRGKSIANPDEMDAQDHVNKSTMHEGGIDRHGSSTPSASGVIPVGEVNLEAIHAPSYGLKESKDNLAVNEKLLSCGSKQQEIGPVVDHCHETDIKSLGDETPVLEHRMGVGVELENHAPCANGRHNSVQVDHCYETVQSSQGNDDAVARQADSGAGIEMEFPKQVNPVQSTVDISESTSVPDGSINNYGEISSSCRHSMVRRGRKDHISYQAFPQLKRKKVPWSAEEEKTLKSANALSSFSSVIWLCDAMENVRGFYICIGRFAEGDGKAIPWTTIWEFGKSVFHEGRTPGDLKDKWRNMRKAKKPCVS
ncbi:hypothetical protein AKJ16_DCAP18892 [Drosera capensis]